MSTVHNEAQKDAFAPIVLMPGDPLRAKFIAENFLTDAVQINGVRGMLGYTGYYKTKRVSVMGSGMGIPSIGIYSYELFTHYNVNAIIRVGTCGGYSEKVHAKDIILAQGACTNSNFAAQYNLPGTFAPIADYELLSTAKAYADNNNLTAYVGNVFSSDIFYDQDPDAWKRWAAMGVLAVEMEAAALYMIAASLDKKALAVLTVSDHFIYPSEDTTSAERERSFTDMIHLALELA
jgi:purine-nucleoside phosphorylase